jgi:transcriptional regulator with XRE-family HTH domain
LREAHGLSQKELAGKLGVSAAYISQLEAGKKSASPRILEKLSTYFRVEKSWLFTPPLHDERSEPCCAAPSVAAS